MLRRPWRLVGWVIAALLATSVGGRIALTSACLHETQEVCRTFLEIPRPEFRSPRPLRGDPLPGEAWDDYREALRWSKLIPQTAANRAALRTALPPLLLGMRRVATGSMNPSDLGWFMNLQGRLGPVFEDEVSAALQGNEPIRALDLALAELTLRSEIWSAASDTWARAYLPQRDLVRIEQILASGSAGPDALLETARMLARLESAVPAPGDLNRIRARQFGRAQQAEPARLQGEWEEDRLPLHLGLRYAWSEPLRTISSLRHYQRALKEAEALERLPLAEQVRAGRALQALDRNSWFGWTRNGLHPGYAAWETAHELRRLRGLRQAALYLAESDVRLEDPVEGHFDVVDEHGFLTVRCGCHDAVVVQLHRS